MPTISASMGSSLVVSVSMASRPFSLILFINEKSSSSFSMVLYLIFSNEDGSPATCFKSRVNSSSRKRPIRSALSGSFLLYSLRFISIGQSVIIVASSLLSLAISLDSFSASASLGFFSLSILDRRFSMLPNSAINAVAVFSPIP